MPLPQRDPAVVFQRLTDGAVLFLPRSEVYFGLNEVGTRVWDLLTPDASLESIGDALQAAYPDVERATILQDVTELLQQLLAEELLLPPGSDAPAAP